MSCQDAEFHAGHAALGPRPHRPIGPVATLTRPPRSLREVSEGRKAAAELDRILGLAEGSAPLAVQELAGDLHHKRPPARLVVTTNRTGCLWVVCWQNAATGAVEAGRFHHHPADAYTDFAQRIRAAGSAVLRRSVA